MLKYVNDLILVKDIQNWKQGDKILISTQTGSGKSTFVETKLYNYCKENNKKILWLSNRNILKQQILARLDEEEKHDVITVRNYQFVETILNTAISLLLFFQPYDYIVFDEVHYIFLDSSFNTKTDLMLDVLKEKLPDKILLFMTATPQPLLFFTKKFDYKYNIDVDYSYIENLYFYSKDKTLDNIIKRIPSNEKIIYFANQIEDAKELSEKYPDAKFICSESNTRYQKYISKFTSDEIINKAKFSCRILSATRVLDNGINIEDESVKHIFIEICDPVELIQCLGRKRIINDEKINVYIRYRNKFEIQGYINRANHPLFFVDELNRLGKDEFQNKYTRDNFDSIIHNNFTINEAKKALLYFQKNFYNKILEQGFKHVICRLLRYSDDKTINADKAFSTLELTEILEQMLDVKMFKDEKENFKNKFLEAAFSPRVSDYRKRGINTINGVITDDALPYKIYDEIENKGEKRNSRYWIVRRLGEQM